MSSVSNVVWPNYSTTNVQRAASQTTNSLGKDQFLALMIAQLKNQDPLSPMDNTQYIAQMAQFSTVEQLMNIYDEIAYMKNDIGSASSLIGKNVSWNEYNSSGDIVQRSGEVESIILVDGLMYVVVDGEKIGIDYIGQISQTAPVQPDGSENDQTNTDTAGETEDTQASSIEASEVMSNG